MFLKVNKYIAYILLTALLCLQACSSKKEFSDEPLKNYKALWNLIDEHYSFLDIKLPKGKTWQDMYDKYLPEITPEMSEDDLFYVMTKLLAELNDGHINLTAPFDRASFYEWSRGSTDYYRYSLVKKYLGSNYKIAGSLYYNSISYNNHAQGSIAYIRCSTFNSSISTMNILSIFKRLYKSRGIILDLRNNGGGSLNQSNNLASFFTPKDRKIGYMRHKTGAGHNDFSEKQDLFAYKNKYFVWERPLVVLINQSVYSAANDFVLKVKGQPHIFILGGKTGGGGGLPMSSELPNGWSVRYSSTQTFDLDDKQIELGIEPDINVKLKEEDVKQGRDTLIEASIKLINELYNKK